MTWNNVGPVSPANGAGVCVVGPCSQAPGGWVGRGTPHTGGVEDGASSGGLDGLK